MLRFGERRSLAGRICRVEACRRGECSSVITAIKRRTATGSRRRRVGHTSIRGIHIGGRAPWGMSGIVCRHWRMLTVFLVIVVAPVIPIITNLVGLFPFFCDRPANVGLVRGVGTRRSHLKLGRPGSAFNLGRGAYLVQRKTSRRAQGVEGRMSSIGDHRNMSTSRRPSSWRVDPAWLGFQLLEGASTRGVGIEYI